MDKIISIFSSQPEKFLRLTMHLLVAGILPFLISCNDGKYEDKPEEKKMTLNDSIKRGEYLVKSIGCTDCHTPKRMGAKGPEEISEYFLAGHRAGDSLPPISAEALKNGWVLFSPDFTATAGAWGVSFSGNLTSDDTGIGTWTVDQFKTAMREGKFKGQKNGRDLLPPMPWFNYTLLSDEDLESMFKYLQSTEPVNNAVPAPIPPTKLDSLKAA